MVGNDLGVNGCLEDGSSIGQLVSEFIRVDQVSVMSQGQRTFNVIQHQRLGILPAAGSCRGIPHMAHADVAVHLGKVLRPKHLIDQAHPLDGLDLALGPRRVAHRDAAALLPPVLEGKQPIVDRGCHVVPVKIIDAEYAAFLPQLVESFCLFM